MTNRHNVTDSTAGEWQSIQQQLTAAADHPRAVTAAGELNADEDLRWTLRISLQFLT